MNDSPTSTKERQRHWERAWTEHQPDSVSWYQATPEPSLTLIKDVSKPTDPVIDVGGGASTLADSLIESGYQKLTVLDLSSAALAALNSRLQAHTGSIQLLQADVLEHAFEPNSLAVWHDRAVFHFLTGTEERKKYRAQLLRAVRPGGHAIIGTFALDGPERCSGLPVCRYSASGLLQELGSDWTRVKDLRHEHVTPAGKTQSFTFVVVERNR